MHMTNITLEETLLQESTVAKYPAWLYTPEKDNVSLVLGIIFF